MRVGGRDWEAETGRQIRVEREGSEGQGGGREMQRLVDREGEERQ